MSFAGSHYRDAKNSIKTLYTHVMCFGTFDIFHPGHVFYLSEAEKLAEMMTIVIARDARVARLKGRIPHDDEDTRLTHVSHAFRGARVILGDEEDIFLPIRQLHPDLLVFGYDQRVPEDKIRELFPDIEIVRIGGHEVDKWKSSIIRKARENNAKNTLLMPGTGQSVKNYGGFIHSDMHLFFQE